MPFYPPFFSFFSRTTAWTTASVTLTDYETEIERQQLCLLLSSEWLAVSKEEEHWLPCENEDEVDESQKSQWKYESEVYLMYQQ